MWSRPRRQRISTRRRRLRTGPGECLNIGRGKHFALTLHQFILHRAHLCLFTCGRRPTGHGVIQIVVVVVVVVVVVGGETSFIHGHWESPCMVL